VALDELARVEKSVSHLLRFAREEELEAQEFALAEVIDDVAAAVQDRTRSAGIALRTEIDTDGSVMGDPEQLRRVVLNLVGNAIDALMESQSPNPCVSVELGENLAGTEVWLRVRDNGPGISDDAIERIFSPFHTSREKGTGLGLSITKKLVEAHHGSIEVKSSPGSGAEFLVTLPKSGVESLEPT
jgi:signal transduction histidine kinase